MFITTAKTGVLTNGKYKYFIDNATKYEIGRELWRLRQENHLYLRHVAQQTGIPEYAIEGMEIGKFIQYGTLRKLLNFYGKKMRIILV